MTNLFITEIQAINETTYDTRFKIYAEDGPRDKVQIELLDTFHDVESWNKISNEIYEALILILQPVRDPANDSPIEAPAKDKQ